MNNRDMASLSEWSRGANIVLADSVELAEDLLGDWSLTTTKSIEQGSSIMTIPEEVILTSDVEGDSFSPYYTENDMKKIRDWMEAELESGSQAKQDYLPEYMLVYKLIREVSMGMNSRWYPWLQSLPTQFSTGLYLDEVERKHVERMTGEYIKVQGMQYRACLQVFQKLVSSQKSKGRNALISKDFLDWMSALQQESSNGETKFDSLVKWAYSIVFTRSWRSPVRTQAQIVPLGDLANHDSQFANLKPGFSEKDGAFQFFVTKDIEVVGSATPKLYLSYGLTYSPARFLVIFGFCDVTAAYIDANLDFLPDDSDDWPTMMEPSQLVVSTLNGALSEDVWIAFLYKMLQKSQPDVLSRIRQAFDNGEEQGNALVEELLEKWEFEVGMEIQAHYQKLLATDFTPITVAEKDLAEHPNLGMVVNYNLFMRETYLNVLEHVNTFLAQCNEFKALAASGAEKEIVKTITPEPVLDSNPRPQSSLSKPAENTSLNTTNATPSKSSTKTSYSPFSWQPSSAKSSSTKSTETKLDVPESKNPSTSFPVQNSTTVFTNTNSFQPVSDQPPTQNDSFTTKRDEEDSTDPNPPSFTNTNSFQPVLDQSPTQADSFTTKIDKQEDITNPNPPSMDNAQQPSQESFSQNSTFSEYPVDSFYSVPESQKTTDWDGATGMDNIEMDQPASIQSPAGANLNATSRFSSENFSLQSYSSNNPTNDKVANGNVEESSTKTSNGNIPTGNFNPAYYTASRKGKVQPDTDFFTPPTTPYSNAESQAYYDTNSRYPDTNSNQDQYAFFETRATEDDIGSASSPAFPYASENSQMYSEGQTPSFAFGNPNSVPYSDIGTNLDQAMVDYDESPTFPDADMDFQPDADIDFRPDADNSELPSTPTTYTEYMQQRQQEGQSGDGI